MNMATSFNILEKSFGNLIGRATAQIDWKNWFYRNGLPSWRFKDFLSPSNKANIEEWSKKEYSNHKRQVREYKILHRKFEEHEFSAVLFKSCGFPTEFPYYFHGNLDVLVGRKNLRAARSILDKLNYVELRHIEEPEKFLFKKYECGRAVSEVHLHSTIGWGVPFLCDDSFWEREHRCSFEDSFIRYPSKTDSLLITLAHTFYEDKSFSMVNILRIAACLLGEIEWDYALSTARRRGWEDGFKEALGCYFAILNKLKLCDLDLPVSVYHEAVHAKFGDRLLDYPERYPFIKAKKYYYRKIWQDSLRDKKQKIYDTIRTFCWGVEVKLDLFFQKPLVVGFSGLDGSGKSTQIALLRKVFEDCALKTQTIWFRCFCSPIATFLQKFGKHKTAGSSRRHNERHGTKVSKPTRRGTILFLERIFAIIEIFYIYAIKVRYYKLFDRVIFLDRCLLDMGVELNMRYPECNVNDTFLWKIVKWCCVKPDFHIFLDISDSIAVERQVDESFADLGKMRGGYQRFLKEFDLYCISAEKSINEISREIYFNVMKDYFGDWSLLTKKILFATRTQMNPRLGKDE